MQIDIVEGPALKSHCVLVCFALVSVRCAECARASWLKINHGGDELTESGGRLLLSVVGVCCLVCHGACISMLMGFGPGVCLCIVWYGFTISRSRGRREEGRKERRKRGAKFAERFQTRLLCVAYLFHLAQIGRVAVFDAKSPTARTPQAERHVFEEGDGRRVPDTSVNGIEWLHRFHKEKPGLDGRYPMLVDGRETTIAGCESCDVKSLRAWEKFQMSSSENRRW